MRCYPFGLYLLEDSASVHEGLQESRVTGIIRFLGYRACPCVLLPSTVTYLSEITDRRSAPNADGRGRPSLHCRSELHWKLTPHILHRCLARRESALQLGVL